MWVCSGVHVRSPLPAQQRTWRAQIIVANVVEGLTRRPLQQPKEFGTSLLSDYRQVHIGQSAYFMGAPRHTLPGVFVTPTLMGAPKDCTLP